MRQWLTDVIQRGTLSEQTEGYLYGRGCKPETLKDFGFFNWDTRELSFAPDHSFAKKYGAKGERLQGWMIWPLYTPRGVLAGFEGRSTRSKVISCYLIPPTYLWNSVWIGMPQAMPLIWDGGAVWVVEGLFDLLPLQWVIPEGDVVLASRRAGLTDEMLNFLIRFARSTFMVYDRDSSGRRETQKALKALRAAGKFCQDVRYGGGGDPGEVWDSGGVLAMRENFRL